MCGTNLEDGFTEVGRNQIAQVLTGKLKKCHYVVRTMQYPQYVLKDREVIWTTFFLISVKT